MSVPTDDGPEGDAAYWRRRAEEQRDFARGARGPEAVAAHEAIAATYLARAELGPLGPVSGETIATAHPRNRRRPNKRTGKDKT